MRICQESSEVYIQALAISVNRDPSSLENWRCTHIHLIEGEEVELSVLQKIKDSYKDSDCDMIICPDHDILLISRELSELALHRIASLLTAGMAIRPEIISFNIFHDWRAFHDILIKKSKDLASCGAIKGETPVHDFGEISSLEEAFEEAKILRRSRHPQHILVVDDDPITRRVITSAFKEKYALITASDAQEAVTNYLLHAPDIVFLDIKLPDASGFSVLRKIIASDKEAYVVMLSGNSYLDNVIEALNEGACGFIAKPFQKPKMLHYIEDSAMHHQKQV